MGRLIGWVAAAVLVAGLQAAKADTAEDAKRLGMNFCMLGTNGSDLDRMYLVTRALNIAIIEALKKNDEIATARPDEKPPLGDGVPFQSFPDDATVCGPGKLANADGKQILEIRYEFPKAPDANWTDRLVLTFEDGLVRIDDVLFGNDDSGNGLRQVLAAVSRN